MSSFSTRPSLPVPLIRDNSTLLSLAILRTAGVANTLSPLPLFLAAGTESSSVSVATSSEGVTVTMETYHYHGNRATSHTYHQDQYYPHLILQLSAMVCPSQRYHQLHTSVHVLLHHMDSIL